MGKGVLKQKGQSAAPQALMLAEKVSGTNSLLWPPWTSGGVGERTTNNWNLHSPTEQAVNSQTDWDVQFKASSLLASPPGGPHPIPPTKGKRGRGLFLFSLVICVVQQDSLNHNYPGLLLPDISWLPTWLESYFLPPQRPEPGWGCYGAPGGQR